MPVAPAVSNRFHFLAAMAWGIVLSGTAMAVEMTPQQRTFFESKIRPVLVKQCYECHSADAKKLGGKLLLDAPSEMIAGGESGPALIPGDPDASLIVQALRYDGLEMPPKKRLPETVVTDFVTWVKLGAPDPRTDSPKLTRPVDAEKSDLWSLKPVAKVSIPSVADTAWPRDAIDYFVLAKMEQNHLTPSRDADPRALIRRLYFDLTGLPPTLGEI
ncbi:MAG: DUF1549 domain-containing protein, partial [Verrucomicrobiales bacterium]|nr:DUF1549 domain-containing protein [Verrucomicrobiales bacterium]